MAGSPHILVLLGTSETLSRLWGQTGLLNTTFRGTPPVLCILVHPRMRKGRPSCCGYDSYRTAPRTDRMGKQLGFEPRPFWPQFPLLARR